MLVNTSAPAKVANVPEAGRVSAVTPPTVRVVAKFPEIVSVEAVLLATPVPPLAAPKTPVTPVVSGNPVALVKTTALGVPRSGVTKAGEVAKTKAPVPVSLVTEDNISADVMLDAFVL